MEYEVVNLNQMMIEGVSARTKNSDPDMTAVIGGLWEKLWRMDLDRNYKCDFEEFQDENVDNATIYIYISIN